jgi:imidazolonepropionase-like amidohydrolase
VLESVVALGRERVPVAFGLESPASPEALLRISAAMCVRAGLDPAQAWEGLTTTAAAVAGVGARVGKLAAGCDADIVLWSGDPLQLTSKVESVFIGGVQHETKGGAGHGGAH